MRIIVTGAAGLVGAAIAEHLGGEHDVVGVDLRAAPRIAVRADCHDVADWGPSLGAVDAIVHVAALHAPHVGVASDADFRRANVEATARLLDHAFAVGARHFVLTSTTSLYGRALEPTDKAVWVDEQLDPQPRDIYDVTKLAAEELVRSAATLSPTILRMSRCFPEPAPVMAGYRLHRGIDRRDVAEAHALALAGTARAARTYVISAATPFEREDCTALLADAPAVIERRCPGLAARFARRAWPLPGSIDRVYDVAAAVAGLGFVPRFGVGACFAGDWDPQPLGS